MVKVYRGLERLGVRWYTYIVRALGFLWCERSPVNREDYVEVVYPTLAGDFKMHRHAMYKMHRSDDGSTTSSDDGSSSDGD